MTTDFLSVPELKSKLAALLANLYPDADPDLLVNECLSAIGPRLETKVIPPEQLWSELDCLLITYGNSIRTQGEKPLQTLQSFLHRRLQDTFSAVHVLPFSPHSSDGGFAVQRQLRWPVRDNYLGRLSDTIPHLTSSRGDTGAGIIHHSTTRGVVYAAP